PNPAPQTFELNNLRMVDKEIHVGPKAFDIPAEDSGIGGFEHHLLQSHRLDHLRDNIGSPSVHALTNAFGFDHDHLRAGIEELSRQLDHPRGIARALGFERLDRTRAAGAELDPDFRFGAQAGTLHSLYQAKPVVGWNRDESGRQLNRVEAQRFAL